MQLADAFEVFSMLDGDALRAAVEKHRPDVDHPGDRGDRHRDARRARRGRLARRPVRQGRPADHEPRRHPRLRRATSSALPPRTTASPKARERSHRRCRPRSACPASSSRSCRARARARARSKTAEDVERAWDYAVANMRGDRPRVIVEEFIAFDSEITLLTVATKDGVIFCAADRPSAGARRLSRELAAGRDPARGAAVSPLPGAQGGRGARRPRHLRRRILRPRRPGDLLRAVAAAARHRHGHADLAIPQRVRAALCAPSSACRSRRSSSPALPPRR